MSRSKRRRARFKGPIFGVKTPERRTDRAPPPSVGAFELEGARREGEKAIETKVDGCIDQVLADAQALETSAKLLDDAPRWIFPVPHKAETVAALFALAAGMRLAADRMPDSREIPF
jgi:hypothetical protein